MFRFLVFLLVSNTALNARAGSGDSLRGGGSFRINYDNDFFSATDYYYTQGIRFEYYARAIRKIPLNKLLFSPRSSTFQDHSISINQLCFTPTSIRRDTVFTGNRPFAGAIFLGIRKSSRSFRKKESFTSEIDLGAIGPCASCRETQENIHKWLHNIQPLGWQFQVGNDLVLNYSFEFEKEVLSVSHFDATLRSIVRAGTLFDDGSCGFRLRAGWINSIYEAEKFSHWLSCHAFAYCMLKGVAYNATLQDGFFRQENIYVIEPGEIQRVTGEITYGIVVRIHKIGLEYTKTWISPEYKHGLDHSWGHCNMTFYF